MNWKGVSLLVVLAALVFAGVVVAAGGGSDDGGTDRDQPTATAGSGKAGGEIEPPDEQEPERKKVPGPHNEPVPILMYHVITDAPADAPYGDLYVPAGEFKEQVEAMAAAGYDAVTLNEVFDYWQKGYELPDKPVVLTFDDGYESQYKNAMPAMRKHDWPGVLFLKYDNMKPSWGLTKQQVEEMIAAGWTVDSHTITHPDVSTLDRAGLDKEIGESRKMLQNTFDQPVDFFCYPAGKYDDEAVAAVERAGYTGAVTTEPGEARPGEPYTLPRVRINSGRSGASVVDELESL